MIAIGRLMDDGLEHINVAELKCRVVFLCQCKEVFCELIMFRVRVLRNVGNS